MPSIWSLFTIGMQTDAASFRGWPKGLSGVAQDTTTPTKQVINKKYKELLIDNEKYARPRNEGDTWESSSSSPSSISFENNTTQKNQRSND